jgi:hypothetical protein
LRKKPLPEEGKRLDKTEALDLVLVLILVVCLVVIVLIVAVLIVIVLLVLIVVTIVVLHDSNSFLNVNCRNYKFSMTPIPKNMQRSYARRYLYSTSSATWLRNMIV